MKQKDIQNILSNSNKIHTLLSTHTIFSRIDHMLGHKISLKKFKKTEIISRVFPDHKGMKLEINNSKKAGKCTNAWK